MLKPVFGLVSVAWALSRFCGADWASCVFRHSLAFLWKAEPHTEANLPLLIGDFARAMRGPQHLGFDSIMSWFLVALTSAGRYWMSAAFSVSAEHMVLITRTADSPALAVIKWQRERIMVFLSPIKYNPLQKPPIMHMMLNNISFKLKV